METHYRTAIVGIGNNTGIEVPRDRLAELGGGARPAVAVTVAGYRYASTVAAMGGRALIPLARAHREAAGLAAGDEVDVVLHRDLAPRVVIVPPVLQAALGRAGLAAQFSALAPSVRAEHCRQVTDAKADATRERRIAKVLAALS